MPEIKEMPNGCYWLWEKPTDYILTEWIADWLPTLYQQDEIIYEYNQFAQKWSQKSCTLFSPIWAISDLFNVEIPLNVIKKWDEDSYNNRRAKDSGWYVSSWVDHICKEWNNSEYGEKYGKVAYYKIDMKDNELVKKILEKRYTICWGYQGNATYNNDKNDNWVLDWTEFGNPTYWHAVGIIWSTKYPARIKDNYKGSKNNIYEVANSFDKIDCFYIGWYVITKVAEDAIEEVKRLNKMKTECLNCIESLWKIWHLTNEKNFQEVLHYTANKLRDKVKTCDEMLLKLK